MELEEREKKTDTDKTEREGSVKQVGSQEDKRK